MKKELLINKLVEQGWFFGDHFIDSSLCSALLAEAQHLDWKQAKIGKGNQKQEVLEIRNDSISWIDEDNASLLQQNYLSLMKELMQTLNFELYLGLKDFECHFAQYKKDGFYKKHLDQHLGSNARAISTILYLNQPSNGGELVIYNKNNPELIDATISPRLGTFVCFLSNQIYHEVLPTQDERFSLTGWFRTSIK